MSKVTDTPTTSRRGLLASAAALAAIVAAPAAASSLCHPPNPDTALLAACAAFAILDDEMNRLDAAPDPTDEELTDAVNRWHRLYETIDPLPARTLPGLQVKTRVMMAAFQRQVADKVGSTVESSAEYHELGVWHLMQDVLAMGSAVA